MQVTAAVEAQKPIQLVDISEKMIVLSHAVCAVVGRMEPCDQQVLNRTTEVLFNPKWPSTLM